MLRLLAVHVIFLSIDFSSSGVSACRAVQCRVHLYIYIIMRICAFYLKTTKVKQGIIWGRKRGREDEIEVEQRGKEKDA